MGLILTVDDSRMMRQMIGGSVEALGYGVLEAENGQAALDLLDLRGDEIELILLDVNMPVMDGFQTLQALKDDDRLRHIPVIMVTTEGEKARIVQAIRMGAINYVVKPFTPEELGTRIVDALDQAGA
jgi:two-component system chemotaxis response regulator CheY